MSECNPNNGLGWITVSLGNIVHKLVDGSHNPPKPEISGMPMLSARNIEDGRIVWTDYRLISSADFVREHARTRIQSDDVLLTIVGSIGRAACVSLGDKLFTLQRSVAVIQPIFLLSKFLMFQFLAPRFQQYLKDSARGTAQKGVYLNTLSQAPVLLTPIGEQRRIIESLESYLSRLDAAAEGLKRVEANLKRYRASVLKAAVEGRLVPTEAELAKKEGRDYEPASVLLDRILKERRRRWEEAELAKMKAKGQVPKDDKWKNKYAKPAAPDASNLPILPNGWCWARFEQLTTLITSGSRGWAEYYAPDGPMFIRAQDIKTDYLRISDIAHVQIPPDSEGMRTRVLRGDLLITITGANVTKSALVDKNLEEAYVSQHVGLCRLVDTEIAPFLYYFIVSPTAGRKQLEHFAYGAGKPGLNLDNLRDLYVALPPASEQIRIIDALSSYLDEGAASERSIIHAVLKLSRLRQSILKWAFEGKLVDQDPSDEPASVLLDRIRAERAAASESPRAARGRKKKSS